MVTEQGPLDKTLEAEEMLEQEEQEAVYQVQDLEDIVFARNVV